MPILFRRSALVAAAALLLFPVNADAQLKASEQAGVSQTIDGTTITLEYSRPVARGRELFGELVPWNAVWTPGANWATTLETDADLRVNGVEVPAGRYSVWAIPRPDRWTITLNSEARLFHVEKPDSTGEQIHVAAEPAEAPHVEMLTWSFPVVRSDGAILALQWGTTRVPLELVVQPSREPAPPEEDVDLYVGTYDLTLADDERWPATVRLAAEGDLPAAARLEVFEEEGRLRGRLPFPLGGGDANEFDLIPAGSHRFNPGDYREGVLLDVDLGVNLEFDAEDGPTEEVRLRAADGSLLAEGTRSGA